MVQNYEIFPNKQPKSLIFIKKPLVFAKTFGFRRKMRNFARQNRKR